MNLRAIEHNRYGKRSSKTTAEAGKISIGDRVVCTYNDTRNLKDKVGTFKCYSLSGNIGIEFDANINGHDCDDNCKRKHGWYVSPKHVKKIK
jgi:hypothetical protein